MAGLVAAKLGDVNVAYREDGTSSIPSLRIPTEGGGDTEVVGGRGVASYLARVGNAEPQLLGKTDVCHAQIAMWCDFAAAYISLPSLAWTAPIQNLGPYSEVATRQAEKDITSVLTVLESVLEKHPFLVQESSTPSLADLVVAASLLDLFRLVLHTPVQTQFPVVTAWFVSVVGIPEFVAVAGPTTLATTRAVYGESGSSSSSSSSSATAAASSTLSSKGNPLDDLPPSAFDLAAFKREYTNKDARNEAIPYLWEHFDPEGYSWWHCEYKYNEQLTLPFKASNLVGGLMQRLPKLHKYGFGSIVISGDDNNLRIHGVWMFRGTHIPQHMEENGDRVHYTFSKLDWERDREVVNDYLAWDGPTFVDTTVVDGKVYK